MKLLGEGINTRGSFCKNGKCNIVLQSLSQGHLVYQVKGDSGLNEGGSSHRRLICVCWRNIKNKRERSYL